MIELSPTTLEGHGVRLEPMRPDHADGIARAAADGELWNLFVTSVPAPDEVAAYVETALEGQAAGHMMPWAVCLAETGEVVGSTRYHDILPQGAASRSATPGTGRVTSEPTSTRPASCF